MKWKVGNREWGATNPSTKETKTNKDKKKPLQMLGMHAYVAPPGVFEEHTVDTTKTPVVMTT